MKKWFQKFPVANGDRKLFFSRGVLLFTFFSNSSGVNQDYRKDEYQQ